MSKWVCESCSGTRAVFSSKVLATGLLLAGLFLGGPSSTPAADVPPDSAEQASIRPDVRLRKLHLVRPDLIPYPIAHEVVC